MSLTQDIQSGRATAFGENFSKIVRTLTLKHSIRSPGAARQSPSASPFATSQEDEVLRPPQIPKPSEEEEEKGDEEGF